MNAPAPSAGVAPPRVELDRLFAVQRAAFERERFPGLATRRDRLQRLMKLTVDNEDRIVAAIAQDFGHRSAHETRLAECYIVASATRHALRHLKRWMKPVRVATPLHLSPDAPRSSVSRWAWSA
jgi:coniferyl-aldehyde dehydrogenase